MRSAAKYAQPTLADNCLVGRQGYKVDWQSSGRSWESLKTTLRLQGWTLERRVFVTGQKTAEQKVEAAGFADTVGGPVQACWDSAPTITRNGCLAYFIYFLEVSNTEKEFVDSCPLTYSNPNSRTKEEILSTFIE